MKQEGARLGIGRYDEARVLYTTEAFRPKEGEPRTVHLGIDLFVEAGTEIRSPLEGRVHSFAFNDQPLDYGPTILLEHRTEDGDRFYTLYGHLSADSLEGLARGRPVSRRRGHRARRRLPGQRELAAAPSLSDCGRPSRQGGRLSRRGGPFGARSVAFAFTGSEPAPRTPERRAGASRGLGRPSTASRRRACLPI